ncbi:centriolar coiled-coil protein of 110 kDa-like isoform X2 [Cololabis saira]|uniref:centriolar coiled-coil protein of 110 kDa-like isoform X2 n=1 Tax=Cololabis saira TaxID=129043 RepID=UPI002AD3D94E|nr:centriolar coiled-coil protein of 110 kDa-like isoform X2 [Cololabis saira]
MCGRPEMESYEDFCLRSLAILREAVKLKQKTCEPLRFQEGRSVIRFHGRPVLQPLLNAEHCAEMCGYRQKAVQLEIDLQNLQRNKLLDRVQGILDRDQVHKVSNKEEDKVPVSKSATVSGYTLVIDSPGLSRDPGFVPQVNEPVKPCPDPPTLRGYKREEDVALEKQEKSEDEEDDDEDISLDSLLKRSREYVKREHQRSKPAHVTNRSPPPETVSIKDEKNCSPVRDAGVEFGFSLHHSPIGPPPIHQFSLYDSNPQKPVCISPSTPERYGCVPSPKSSISPRPNRRKPRPVSTGNIHITFPIGPAELIPRSPGRSGQCTGMLDWGETLSVGTTSSGHCGLVGTDGVKRSGIRPTSHCGISPEQENGSPVRGSLPSSMPQHDHLSAGFRRRCHTLDSHLNTYQPGAEHIDRSQERMPRLMAGVTRSAQSRRTTAAPLNQTYEVDNTSPSLLRSHVTPDFVTLGMELDNPQGPNNGKKMPTVLRNTTESQASKAEDAQWRAQALEDMAMRLEEEHALQMSSLIAEQEKEQQQLRLELEETERRLKEQSCACPVSGETCGWSRRSVSGSCPVMSPSCPGLSPIHTPSERSPGHSFPSPVPSGVSSPSVQSPVYLWGSTWAANKPRARLSLVVTVEHQRAFCRIGAMIRGFLVRRLLQTEKVKHLRQTIGDTQVFIQTFQTEATQRNGIYTAQDLMLQERVRAQLRAALYDIHEIFFEMPLRDRFALLQQEKELRAERKLRELEKVKCPKERVSLSTATQRSLDRKKKVSESPAQTRKIQHKLKSPTTNRVPKQSQPQNSGQLNRQGSWNRKNPEERLRRSDSLKKQHSLG